MTWPKLALLLTGLGFLGFGIAFVVWPLPMARLTEIPLPTPTARIDFAANYGGVQAALGVFFLMASRQQPWIEPGLWAATAVLAGLVLVRLQSIFVIDGSPSRIIFIALAIEVAGALVCLHALRRLRATGSTP